MHTQSKPGPVFEQKLCQDILHQNAHGWINIDLGVCGRNLGLRLQPLVQYLQERRYCRALDKLQRLVIQRLFELHKLNVSQTGQPTIPTVHYPADNVLGYKLWMHISKSLQVQCKTIRKAVVAYNRAVGAGLKHQPLRVPLGLDAPYSGR